MKSFRSIIELWPTRETCAEAIGKGATAQQVSKWWQRDNIPAEWWPSILSTRPAATAGVTADLMASLAARRLDTASLANEVTPA